MSPPSFCTCAISSARSVCSSGESGGGEPVKLLPGIRIMAHHAISTAATASRSSRNLRERATAVDRLP
jgi:hypothetical protein